MTSFSADVTSFVVDAFDIESIKNESTGDVASTDWDEDGGTGNGLSWNENGATGSSSSADKRHFPFNATTKTFPSNFSWTDFRHFDKPGQSASDQSTGAKRTLNSKALQAGAYAPSVQTNSSHRASCMHANPTADRSNYGGNFKVSGHYGYVSDSNILKPAFRPTAAPQPVVITSLCNDGDAEMWHDSGWLFDNNSSTSGFSRDSALPDESYCSQAVYDTNRWQKKEYCSQSGYYRGNKRTNSLSSSEFDVDDCRSSYSNPADFSCWNKMAGEKLFTSSRTINSCSFDCKQPVIATCSNDASSCSATFSQAEASQTQESFFSVVQTPCDVMEHPGYDVMESPDNESTKYEAASDEKLGATNPYNTRGSKLNVVKQ